MARQDISVKYVKANRLQLGAETDTFTVERYRQFCKFIPGSSSIILDVGCSTGRGGDVLKQSNSQFRIIGLDCVMERLGKVSSSYVGRILGYSTSIPSKDNAYDVVIAGEFIEHLDDSDVMPTLKEFHRVLVLGGRVLLTTPNPDSLKLRLRGGSVLGGAHFSEHRPKDLTAKIVRVGFKIVFLRGSGKATRIFPERFPIMNIFGSYLLVAEKHIQPFLHHDR